MEFQNDLLLRARKIFPEAKTDREALDMYAGFVLNSAKKYVGKKKLKAVFEEVQRKYHAINELRKTIN